MKSQHCQILFCKVSVPLVKFAIKDVNMIKNRQKWVPYPDLAPYNTREEE